MNINTFLRHPGALIQAAANRSAKLSPARRLLLTGAALAAACLMLKYVLVCHEAVQRGDDFRAEQRALGGQVVNAGPRQGRT